MYINANNFHTIHGRMVRDPLLTKGAEESKNLVKFTVAVDRSYGDETDFIDCVAFGVPATLIDKYFSRGSEILLLGEGQIRSYDDKNGIRRKAYSINVVGFGFCGSKSDGSRPAPTDPEPNFDEVTEDIPFR